MSLFTDPYTGRANAFTTSLLVSALSLAGAAALTYASWLVGDKTPGNQPNSQSSAAAPRSNSLTAILEASRSKEGWATNHEALKKTGGGQALRPA